MPHANEQNAFDPDRYRHAEAQLGGAEALVALVAIVSLAGLAW